MTDKTGIPLAPDAAVRRALDVRLNRIPAEVIEVVNNILVEALASVNPREITTVTIYQDQIIAEIMSVLECSRDDVFANKYLDFEDKFRDVGWEVVYNKPHYSETWRPNFRFSWKT